MERSSDQATIVPFRPGLLDLTFHPVDQQLLFGSDYYDHLDIEAVFGFVLSLECLQYVHLILSAFTPGLSRLNTISGLNTTLLDALADLNSSPMLTSKRTSMH